MAANYRMRLAWCAGLAVVGGAAAWLAGGQSRFAVLGAAAGVVLGWGIHKKALRETVRGSAIGAMFALVVGPVADWAISGRPVRDSALPALVVGLLVGGALGAGKAKRKKE